MAVSQQTIPISFLDFSGGINTRFSQLSLQENEVPDMENFHIEPRGGLEKRGGYDFWYGGDTATTFDINGLYHFKPTDAVVRIQNGSVHANTGAGWGSDLKGALTIEDDPDATVVFATFKDTLVGTNGVNVPFKWTGSGNFAAITTTFGGDDLTKARFVVMHRERLIYGNVSTDAGGGTDYPSRLLPSEVGTIDTLHSDLTTGKIIDVDEGDGDELTAGVEAMGYLIVFKQNSLHRINDYGLTGVQQRYKVANVGCPGPHAVCVVGNIVFFLDIVGQLWAYDPKGTNQDSVINLSERKLGPDTLDTINKNRLDVAHLWHDPVRNELRAFMTTFGGTTTDIAWTFNITSGGFGKLVYTDPFNVSARWIDADGEVRCIVGTNNGEVYLLDEGVDDAGETYTAYVVTRWLDFGDNSVIKGTRFFHLYGTVLDDQDLTLEHRVDLIGAGSTQTITLAGPGVPLDVFELDTDVLSGSGDSLVKARTEAYARWHQFKVTQAEDLDIRIIGFVLMVVTSGRDRDGT